MDPSDIHPSNSQIQQKAERVMIDSLAARLGIALESRAIDLGDGSRVQIDGFSQAPPVLVEASARQGLPRGAQFHKIASDALKLHAADVSLGLDARKILLFADESAATPFRGNTWRGAAIASLGVEVIVIDIPSELREQIRAAQRRQYR